MAAEITIYKKNPCPYCDRALNFLNARDLKYTVVDLTDKPDEMQAMKQKWGWQTVPIIVINGKLIGGYNDMKALDDEGKFDELVKN